MNKSLYLFIISVLFLAQAYGQSKEDKKLAKNLDELIPKRLTGIAPGCVVLVVKKDEII